MSFGLPASRTKVSRAQRHTPEHFRERMGWAVPWYSSLGSDFNYDFHVTLDQAITPVEYNFKDQAELERDNPAWRGSYNWLDLTARGRQEDWEPVRGLTQPAGDAT